MPTMCTYLLAQQGPREPWLELQVFIEKKKKKAGRSKKHQVETFRVGVRREEPRYRVSLDRMYFEMLKGATYSYVFL